MNILGMIEVGIKKLGLEIIYLTVESPKAKGSPLMVVDASDTIEDALASFKEASKGSTNCGIMLVFGAQK